MHIGTRTARWIVATSKTGGSLDLVAQDPDSSQCPRVEMFD